MSDLVFLKTGAKSCGGISAYRWGQGPAWFDISQQWRDFRESGALSDATITPRETGTGSMSEVGNAQRTEQRSALRSSDGRSVGRPPCRFSVKRELGPQRGKGDDGSSTTY